MSRISGALEDAEFVQSLKKYIENNELEFKKSEAKFNIVEKKKSLDRRIDIIRAMKEGSVLTDVVSVSKDHYQDKTSHPTQKPVHIMEMLVKLVSGENSLILDPFSGSGSTALACQNLNRKFIAFEIDKEYYEKSLERIKNNVTQLDLFEDIAE